MRRHERGWTADGPNSSHNGWQARRERKRPVGGWESLTAGGRFFCQNCRGAPGRKPVHSAPDHDALAVISCNDRRCECRCRTSYLWEDGRRYPYGSGPAAGRPRPPPEPALPEARPDGGLSRWMEGGA